MADSSFDIVSKIDRQEVDNALGQTAREIATRFDFKGTGATIEWQGEHAIEITASADDRANAVLDVFKGKLVKRQVSLKTLDASEPRQSGQQSKIAVALKEGGVGLTVCFPSGEGAGPQAPSDYGLMPSRHEKEGGIFRVNIRTGEMSICYVFDDKTVCTPQTK